MTITIFIISTLIELCISGLVHPPSYSKQTRESQLLESLIPQENLKNLEESINIIGDSINRKIGFIHDSDHGVRVCNVEDPSNQGVCFTESKCQALGGHNVGFCSGFTPKTTCCKFEIRNGMTSSETVCYFDMSTKQSENETKDFQYFIKSRFGSCQVRVDILGHINAKNILIEGLNSSYVFSEYLNSDSHFYIHVEQQPQVFKFNFNDVMTNGLMRITQVNCRSRSDYMNDIKAPKGCFLYHDRPWKFPLLNFRNRYNVCLKGLIPPTVSFNSTNCEEEKGIAKLIILDPSDENGNRLQNNQFSICNNNGGEEQKIKIKTPPFIFAVESSNESSQIIEVF